jgi:3,4-dihydroxy 2-butanone 4-phosphate synthase / GTP cyclohydrolase II
MIIVVDDEDRENEGDLTIAAEKVTPEAINFMAKHGRGLICLAMTGERLDELEMPLMVSRTRARSTRRSACRSRPRGDEHRHLGGRPRGDGPGGHRSGDAARPTWRGPGTCSRCARATAACSSGPARPRRRWIWRGSPGLYPAGVICEIMNEDGTMARVPELAKFARKHKLLMITIADLIQYRMRTEASCARARGEAADRVRRLPVSPTRA